MKINELIIYLNESLNQSKNLLTEIYDLQNIINALKEYPDYEPLLKKKEEKIQLITSLLEKYKKRNERLNKDVEF